MAISFLRIGNFRNLSAVQITPVLQGLNIISGNNGSGKTSLLEAIFYLSHGKSFRSSVANRLINHEADRFFLFSHIQSELQRQLSVGMERERAGSNRLRVDENEAQSLAQIACYLPIRLIDSHAHDLLEGGPAFRRKFLDWGLFYQYPEFITSWRHYERVLKQRNSILREKRPRKELDAWTNELIKYGLELNQQRNAYIASFLPQLQYFSQNLLGISQLEINYQPGWESNTEFATALHESVFEDYRLGHTQAGPHRADFDLISEGLSLRHVLSRGQQKLLICAMILAQGKLLADGGKSGLIYLVDDLPSELDLLSRQKLVSLLSAQKSQIFITAIENQAICDLISDKTMVPIKVFHVEHGEIVEVAARHASISSSYA